MERNLKKGEKIVKGMTSTFGFIKSLFSSSKNQKNPSKGEERKGQSESGWEDVADGKIVDFKSEPESC